MRREVIIKRERDRERLLVGTFEFASITRAVGSLVCPMEAGSYEEASGGQNGGKQRGRFGESGKHF